MSGTSPHGKGGKYVIGLLIAGFLGAMVVLYAADRILKARVQARRVRRMTERLDAATARAERQQRQRQTAARASVAETSVLPAIKRPPAELLEVPPRPAGDSPVSPAGTGTQPS
jgi:hypothetical protein